MIGNANAIHGQHLHARPVGNGSMTGGAGTCYGASAAGLAEARPDSNRAAEAHAAGPYSLAGSKRRSA
jgi:hypothetical protein